MRDQFEGWAVVEMLGHRRLVGKVSQVELAGVKMLRVDIPSTPATFIFVNPLSLYALSPTTQEEVRAEIEREAEQNRRAAQRQLSAPTPEDDDEDVDDRDPVDDADDDAAGFVE